MKANRSTPEFTRLRDYIDRTAAYVDTWPYWKRGGSFAEAEDQTRQIAEAP